MHTLVWTVTLVQLLGQRANQQASRGLFHTEERTVACSLMSRTVVRMDYVWVVVLPLSLFVLLQSVEHL